MARVELTLACGAYDRTAALVDRRVHAEGVDLNVVLLEPEECFWRMLRHAEFDVAELSLASYWIARSHGDDRFVGLPVFLSRSFRHSSLYLPPGSDIAEPAQLAGGRIGVPEYQMTASVWTRGFLSDDHEVRAEDVTWVTGGLTQPGRAERQPLSLPPRIRTERLADATLDAALRNGSIDALMAPRVPPAFRDPGSGVRRLFDDYAGREEDFYRRTGIFPIMHLVVLRADLHERHPWLAQSLTKAFWAAKDAALDGIADAPALRLSLPFLLHAVEHQAAVFGEDPWPYGLEANRATLETFARHLIEQGLADDPVPPDELFAPSTRFTSRI